MNVTKHVVLFLDILGYSNIISSSEKRENEYLKRVYSLMTGLKSFIDKRNQVLSVNNKGLKLNRINSCLFSDNIVIFAPYENEIDKFNLAMNILRGVGEFLFQYNKNEFFFRGAVTAGMLFYDEKRHFLFGSGLVKAASLEEKAETPRILIDIDTISEVLANKRMFPYQSILPEIAIEETKVYFDYLRYGYCAAQKVLEAEEIRMILNNHKEAIERALKVYSDNPYVHKKYLWLANYHNQFCKEKFVTDYVVKIV